MRRTAAWSAPDTHRAGVGRLRPILLKRLRAMRPEENCCVKGTELGGDRS